MTKTMHETERLPYDGAVDADGHILEPPDLWETYIEPKYRDRALRIVHRRERPGGARDRRPAVEDEPAGLPVDARRDGRSRPAGDAARPRAHVPARGAVRQHGSRRAARGARRRGHRRRHPLHDRRAAVGGRARGSRAVARPTPAPTTGGSASSARAPTASCRPRTCRSTDPAAAAAELERAVGEGAKGAYVAPFTHDGRPLGHPDNDPVFAAAQDLDVPFAIHPTFEPQWTKGTRMGTWENVKQLRLLASVTASDGVRHQFTTLFDYGVFDKFPRLRCSCSSPVAAGSATGSTASTPSTGTRSSARACRSSTSRATTSASGSGSRATPTSARSRPSPSGSAPTGSCGRRTSRTPTTRPSTCDDLDELAGLFPDEHRAQFLGDNARELFAISGLT